MPSTAKVSLPYPSFVSRTTAFSAQINADFAEIETKFNNRVDRSFVNALDWCVGDGTTDDTAGLQAAVTAATNGVLYVPFGNYLFTATLAIPEQTTVLMAPGARLSCGITNGSNGITLANAAKITGLGGGGNGAVTPRCGIFSATGATVGALVTNAVQTQQEFMFLENLLIQPAAASTVATLIDLVSVFGHSNFRSLFVNGNGIATNCVRVRGGASAGAGQIGFVNCWIHNATQDVISIEGTAGGTPEDVWFHQCLIQYWGSGYAGVKCKTATNTPTSVSLKSCHFELAAAPAATSYCVYADQCVGLSVDDCSYHVTSATNSVGIYWTAAAANQRGWVRGFICDQSLTTILNDAEAGVSFGGKTVSLYQQANGNASDIYFNSPLHGVQISDGTDVTVGTTTGSKIGQSSSKMGFFGATPVVKQATFTQTYSTADTTLATPTSATVTDAFGTADGTIADVGSSFSQTTLNNNFQDIATAYNALRADHLDLAQFVNSLVDAAQALGLIG